MIEQPPHIDATTASKLIEFIASGETPRVQESLTHINNEYLYWSDVKYRAATLGLEPKELWALVKRERAKTDVQVWAHDGVDIHFSLTNTMQRECHNFDMDFGGSWGASKVFPEDKQTQELYLISSIMEEAIASSQMEGASTTREAAKEMLRRKITPRDRSQRMILNNYNTISFIRSHVKERLTPELIMQLHAMMTAETLDVADAAGRMRRPDEHIVVGDGITGETVHTPPPAECLPEFMEELCAFFNDENPKVFVHPIIRAIIVHFLLAYYHPFADGNGRTARALFYWFMMKSDYWLVQYLSISRVIIKTKKAYEKAYLYSESDGNDIGYFIKYNLDVLQKSFEELRLYIKRKSAERKQSERLLRLGNISARQAQILNRYIEDPDLIVEARTLANRLGVSYMTAKSDLNDLATKGYLNRIALNGRSTAFVRSSDFNELISHIRI